MAARKTPASPKPDKLMRDALAIELHREDTVEEGGRTKKIKRLRRIARALVDKGIAGDTPAIKEIYDRMDGKVPMQVTGKDEAPLIPDYTDEQRVAAMTALLAKAAVIGKP
jgi:hypothetical protein